MKKNIDIVIVGAGPVGLMCSYLGQLCGLNTAVIDKSEHPLEVGRADALNARSLQLLELVDLFNSLYTLGKKCNTSSVWENGRFLSRQSYWWDELEGCLHKHFLMIGQAYIENLLDTKLKDINQPVIRNTLIQNIEVNDQGCVTTFANGEKINSKYIIGADGSRSFVRNHFNIDFEIIKPQIIWAVIDGVIDSDFPKVPEIIVFQAETSDVAWIPREGEIDRFYIRMDFKNFTVEDAVKKINNAMKPHKLSFKEIVWFSQFSVKESVAKKYFVQNKVFLAGDACHIHSVNGGQGLNTGLADAFNLMWKLNMVLNYNIDKNILHSYEKERRPVALSVINSSGELVRSTKYSPKGTHAKDYVENVEKYAGNITGMGISYKGKDASGSRLFDFEIFYKDKKTRLYSLLDYTKFTLLIFGNCTIDFKLPDFVKIIFISTQKKNLQEKENIYYADSKKYVNKAVLVRPDSYISALVPIKDIKKLFHSKKELI